MSPESFPRTPAVDPTTEIAQQLEAEPTAVQVEEGELAVRGIDSTTQDLQTKAEKLSQRMAFTKALGSVALKRAVEGKIGPDEDDEDEIAEHKDAVPQTFIQRQQAKRAFKKADALHQKRLQDKIKLDIYGPSMGKSDPLGAPLRAVKTVALRHKLKQEARDEFLAGNISRSKRDQLIQVAGMTKAERDFTKADLDELHDKKARKLEKKLQSPILQEVRQSRLRTTERKIDELNGISPYDRLADVLFPNIQEHIEHEPETTEKVAEVTPTSIEIPKPPKKSALERLREMREAGLLPDVTSTSTETEVVVNPEPETASEETTEEDGQNVRTEQITSMKEALLSGTVTVESVDDAVRSGIARVGTEYIYSGGHAIPGTDEWIPGEKTPQYFVEFVYPEGTKGDDLGKKFPITQDVFEKIGADESVPVVNTGPESEPTVAEAEKSADPEADQTAVQKMAEIAYLAAKREIRRQIEVENEQRRSAKQPELTREEKAEKWKSEDRIRKQMLDTLSPANRDLVEKQVVELEKADRVAHRNNKEQLLQKRDREKREAAAKKRKEAQEAKRKAEQEKKDREAQAAARVARNAAQTAIDS